MKNQDWGENLENLFAAIGLSEKESRVYRVLLESGELPAGEIITKSRLKRGITYAVLYTLEKDGLVSQVKKGKKTFFRPEPPQKLADLLLNKKTQIDYLHNSFSQLLPKLSSQYKLSVGRPTVAYFEGEDGVKALFDDIPT